MIKVSVLYPNEAGGQFDHAYYKDSHMPMVERLLGAACLSWSVDRGVAGGAPGAPPAFVTMCHLLFDSVDAFQASFGPHTKQIMDDVANYTNLTPVIQLSEVAVA